ncbi:MAG: BMP family protein [Candidatus Rokubacteria bacterium]|nr:BMP family protein [Candidatus Rokubacteria bacterium]
MTRVLPLLVVLVTAVLFGSPAPAVGQQQKMAMILPGPVEDGDFNALGYNALKEVGKTYKLETSHSERVAVADAERVAREYINSGYRIVAFHGGQFLTTAQKLAPQFADVSFIIETQTKQVPANVWNINRHFYEGFYPLGVLAALTTKSNRIAYIAGIRLPDFISSLNAVYTAIKETNPKAELKYAFVGDQNDPLKARQSAQAMIGEGADVIVSQLNLGVIGVTEAVKASGKPVIVTTFYTDKHTSAPAVYATSLLLDFNQAYRDVVGSILKGQRTGQYAMRPGQAMSLAPIHNIPADVGKRVEAVYRDVAAGKKVVPDILDKIVVP